MRSILGLVETLLAYCIEYVARKLEQLSESEAELGMRRFSEGFALGFWQGRKSQEPAQEVQL